MKREPIDSQRSLRETLAETLRQRNRVNPSYSQQSIIKIEPSFDSQTFVPPASLYSHKILPNKENDQFKKTSPHIPRPIVMNILSNGDENILIQEEESLSKTPLPGPAFITREGNADEEVDDCSDNEADDYEHEWRYLNQNELASKQISQWVTRRRSWLEALQTLQNLQVDQNTLTTKESLREWLKYNPTTAYSYCVVCIVQIIRATSANCCGKLLLSDQSGMMITASIHPQVEMSFTGMFARGTSILLRNIHSTLLPDGESLVLLTPRTVALVFPSNSVDMTSDIRDVKSFSHSIFSTCKKRLTSPDRALDGDALRKKGFAERFLSARRPPLEDNTKEKKDKRREERIEEEVILDDSQRGDTVERNRFEESVRAARLTAHDIEPIFHPDTPIVRKANVIVEKRGNGVMQEGEDKPREKAGEIGTRRVEEEKERKEGEKRGDKASGNSGGNDEEKRVTDKEKPLLMDCLLDDFDWESEVAVVVENESPFLRTLCSQNIASQHESKDSKTNEIVTSQMRGCEEQTCKEGITWQPMMTAEHNSIGEIIFSERNEKEAIGTQAVGINDRERQDKEQREMETWKEKKNNEEIEARGIEELVDQEEKERRYSFLFTQMEFGTFKADKIPPQQLNSTSKVTCQKDGEENILDVIIRKKTENEQEEEMGLKRGTFLGGFGGVSKKTKTLVHSTAFPSCLSPITPVLPISPISPISTVSIPQTDMSVDYESTQYRERQPIKPVASLLGIHFSQTENVPLQTSIPSTSLPLIQATSSEEHVQEIPFAQNLSQGFFKLPSFSQRRNGERLSNSLASQADFESSLNHQETWESSQRRDENEGSISDLSGRMREGGSKEYGKVVGNEEMRVEETRKEEKLNKVEGRRKVIESVTNPILQSLSNDGFDLFDF